MDDDEGWAAPPSEEYGAPSSGQYAPEDEEPARGRSEELGRAPVEATRMAPSGEHTADHRDEPGMDPEDNPEATRAGPPVMLEITQGPDRGRRKRFAGVRLVIGRAAGCDLELSDQSVSRRHVELVYSEKGVVLRDLGSGNGTRVNGERVTERLLVHDDEIAVGQTRLRFVDEQERLRRLREEAEREEQERKAREQAAAAPAPDGEAAAPSPSSASNAEAAPGGEQPPKEEEKKKAAVVVPPKKPDSRRRKQLAFAVGGALGLLLLLGVGVLWAVSGPSPAEQRYVQAVALLDQARAAAKAGDFAQAIKLAADAERLSPGVDKDKIGERAEADLALMNGLESVRALLAEGSLEQARAQLEKLPKGYEPIAVEARKKVLSELVAKELAALVALIEQRLRSREVEGLELLIAKLPTSQQLRLLVELERVKRELEEEARRRAIEEATRLKDARRLAELRRQITVADAFSKVERRFHEGDYARAVLECDRVIDAQPRDREMRERARRLKKLIPSFEQVWVDAQRKVAANSQEAAVRPLRSSLELYKQIGFRGMIRGQIESQLVRALVVAGKEADRRNELVTAAARYREALSLRQGELEAQKGLFGLQGRVESVFMDASKLELSNPQQAAEKYQIVVQVADQDSDLKRKAEEQLKKLQP